MVRRYRIVCLNALDMTTTMLGFHPWHGNNSQCQWHQQQTSALIGLQRERVFRRPSIDIHAETFQISSRMARSTLFLNFRKSCKRFQKVCRSVWSTLLGGCHHKWWPALSLTTECVFCIYNPFFAKPKIPPHLNSLTISTQPVTSWQVQKFASILGRWMLK